MYMSLMNFCFCEFTTHTECYFKFFLFAILEKGIVYELLDALDKWLTPHAVYTSSGKTIYHLLKPIYCTVGCSSVVTALVLT